MIRFVFRTLIVIFMGISLVDLIVHLPLIAARLDRYDDASYRRQVEHYRQHRKRRRDSLEVSVAPRIKSSTLQRPPPSKNQQTKETTLD